MFDDPYKILGLSPDATDEEVKKAYRALARKYHPDVNPGDEYAARKMNEINAAYDQIKNPPKHDPRQTWDPFSGNQHQYSYGGSGPLTSARQFIATGRYHEALNVLNRITYADRTAEWYCLSAIANTNLGNRVLGFDQINQACRMDPSNEEYEMIRDQIQHHGQVYRQSQSHYNFDGFQLSRLCLSLCICFNLNACCGYRYFLCC